jgi:hypothetical protein
VLVLSVGAEVGKGLSTYQRVLPSRHDDAS